MTHSQLTRRKIVYESDNIKVIKPLDVGSQQGSPLSSLYWNITIADLLGKELPYETHNQAFVDDIAIIVQFKSRKDAQEKTKRVLKITNDWVVSK